MIPWAVLSWRRVSDIKVLLFKRAIEPQSEKVEVFLV